MENKTPFKIRYSKRYIHLKMSLSDVHVYEQIFPIR